MRIFSKLRDHSQLYHFTQDYDTLIQILDSSMLVESEAVSNKRNEGLKIATIAHYDYPVIVSLTYDAAKTMRTTKVTSRSKKGKFGIEVDVDKTFLSLQKLPLVGEIDFNDGTWTREALQDFANRMDKHTKSEDITDTFAYDFLESYKLWRVYIDPDSQLVTKLWIWVQKNTTDSKHNMGSTGVTKDINIPSDIQQEFTAFVNKLDIEQATKEDKPVPNTYGIKNGNTYVSKSRTPKNIQELIHDNLFESEERLAVRSTNRNVKREPDVGRLGVKVHISGIIIASDSWDSLNDSNKNKLRGYNLPINIHISPDYTEVVSLDNYESDVSASIKASQIKFSPRNVHGVKYYVSTDPDAYVDYRSKYSVIQNDFGEGQGTRFYLRIWDADESGWVYPLWAPEDGFRTLADASHWLSQYNWKDADRRHIEHDNSYGESHLVEFQQAMELLGFTKSTDSIYNGTEVYTYEQHKGQSILDGDILIRAMYYDEEIDMTYWVDGKRLKPHEAPPSVPSVEKTIKNIEKILNKYGYSDNITSGFMPQGRGQVIMAAINTRDLTKNLVRVRSSNIWAYCINVRNYGDRNGDVLCQFKGPGGEGPGAIYIYYDVPVKLYRQWVSAPSKGHFFWKYIRNTFKYSKLTGDKRGKLKNAIN